MLTNIELADNIYLLISLKMHSLHREGGCAELKVNYLLDCSDVWELGPKLVFRGSDLLFGFFDMCIFGCVVNSCSLFIMFMFRKTHQSLFAPYRLA